MTVNERVDGLLRSVANLEKLYTDLRAKHRDFIWVTGTEAERLQWESDWNAATEANIAEAKGEE
jgi:hypothetical protein